MSDNDEPVELEALETEPLPDLPDLPDAVEVVAVTGGATETSAEELTPGPATPRELDKAPMHLRKASLIVIVGGLIPWLGDTLGLWTSVVAKAGIFAGMWFLLGYFKYRAGEQVPGFMVGLASKGLGKQKPVKAPRRRGADAGPPPRPIQGADFPALAHLVGLTITVGAIIALPPLDAGVGLANAYAELGMLAWGVATWVHIYGYERAGGKFNPIFPLMFLAHALAGMFGLLARVRAGDALGIAGAALTAAGGLFAAYTIFEAMKQAKNEGDAKKAAALEARKAARGRS